MRTNNPFFPHDTRLCKRGSPQVVQQEPTPPPVVSTRSDAVERARQGLKSKSRRRGIRRTLFGARDTGGAQTRKSLLG